MKKTAGEIESDIYNILIASALNDTLRGEIYRDGIRPANSQTEDAVISFLSGVEGLIQTGVINVNVYVPNIDNGDNQGVLVKDTERCTLIEEVLRDVANNLSVSGDYLLSLDSIIKSTKVDGVEQYFVNCKLNFKRSTF